ncbi:MAG: cytochrome c oxidase accessory protein CcoG [Verrucomicrobia bacterium]|jgi:cytochrome c oxidase accessory protein FixG|nr:MAG: cytochrome c oxidase accessory protein CcoG [Verrucomicrobiota bacterium]
MAGAGTQKQPNLDSVTTINADGSHYILHPADVSGRFTRYRRLFGILLLAVYVLLPWIPINGAPALFLDVENRRFHVMGLTLIPQDLWVLFFAITGLGFGLFLITSLLGRLWCGWACPYTVFLEHVFRRIERWIDGDGPARRLLDAAPWTKTKIIKRVVKQTLYILSAALIAHVFMSYFVSLERLYSYVKEGPLAHATVFTFVTVLTGILWFSFSLFREQFCILMCPYGRLQSALTDDDTIIIGYDEGRGEPRGPKGKTSGSCIDCRRCVHVCPTGIDIRNGLQMECIGCAACIDACDTIMDKIGQPRGLVRYDSLNGLTKKKRRIMRPRILAYLVLALLGLSVLAVIASTRVRPYTAEFSRMRGAPYYVDGSMVRNHYQFRILNKRNQPVQITVTLSNAPQGYTLSGGGTPFTIPALGETQRTAVVMVPHAQYHGRSEITFHIHANPGEVEFEEIIPFLGPDPRVLKTPETIDTP